MKETSFELYKAFCKHWLKISVLLFLAILCNIISVYFFGIIKQLYLNGSVSWAEYQFSWVHLAVMGSVGLVLLSLFIESILVGWEKSSLNYLLNDSSQSRKSDLIYFFLYFSNISSILGFLLSFGLTYWGVIYIQSVFDFSLLKNSSYLIQFVIQFLIGSLVFYIHHYLSHTSWLWEVHKVHHASERMNMVNNFRRHPFEHELRLFLQAIPGVLLGISPVVILLHVIVTGLIVIWQHSNYDWRWPFVEKYLLIGAASHRIHHSKLKKFYGKNFGYFVLWDWAFGTLERHKDLDLEIGVSSDDGFNREHPLKEIIYSFLTELKVLWRKVTLYLLN